MAGGLLQLIAYGSQDLYLTGNPEITPFKAVYRRYNNFSRDDIEIPFKGPLRFDAKSTAIIPRNGDLIDQLTLKIDIPSVSVTYKYTPTQEIALLLANNNTVKINTNIYNDNILRLTSIQKYFNSSLPLYIIQLDQVPHYSIISYILPFFDTINLDANSALLVTQANTYYVPVSTTNLKYLMNESQFNTDVNNNVFKYNVGAVTTFTPHIKYYSPNTYYNIVINANITTWTLIDNITPWLGDGNNRFAYIYNVIGISYLKITTIIVSSFSVTNNISTAKCFYYSGDQSAITNTAYIFSNIDITGTLLSTPTNIGPIISVSATVNTNAVTNTVGYLGTYDDPYQYLASYLLSHLNYDINLQSVIFTGNTFVEGVYALISQRVFNRTDTITLNDNIVAWNIVPSNSPNIWLNYRGTLQLYSLLFLYSQIDATNYLQFGYGIVLNISYTTFTSVINFVFLAGRQDLIDPAESNAAIFVSNIGSTNLNTLTTQPISSLTRLSSVNNYIQQQNNEVFTYDRITKSKINQNTQVQVDISQYSSRQMILTFAINITTWFNNIGVFPTANVSGVSLFNLQLTDMAVQTNLTILTCNVILPNTTSIAALCQGCYISYNRSNIIFSSIIQQVITTGITVNANNTTNTQYYFNIYVASNISSWFLTQFIITPTLTNSVSIANASALLDIAEINTATTTTTVLCTYNIGENFSISNINNILIGTFAYNLINTTQVSQIKRIDVLYFDSLYTYNFVYNNAPVSNSTADYRTLLLNSIQNSMTSNTVLLRDIFSQLYTGINYSFRAFDYNLGVINGNSNEVFNTSNLVIYLNGYLTDNVIQPAPSIYANSTTYLTPFIDQITNQNTNYQNYNLVSFNNIISKVIQNTQYSMIGNIALLIKFYQTSNPNNGINITVNSNLSAWGVLLNVGQLINIRSYNDNTKPILSQLQITTVTLGAVTVITGNLYSATASLTDLIINNYIFSQDDSLSAVIANVDTFYNNYTTRYTTFAGNSTNIVKNGTWFVNFLLLDYMVNINNFLLSGTSTSLMPKIQNATKYLYTPLADRNAVISTIVFTNNDNITITVNSDLTAWGTELNVSSVLFIREVQQYGIYNVSTLVINSVALNITNTVIVCSINITNSMVNKTGLLNRYIYSNDDTKNIQTQTVTVNGMSNISIYINSNINTLWGAYLNIGGILNIRETSSSANPILGNVVITNVIFTYWSTTIICSLSSVLATLQYVGTINNYVMPINTGLNNIANFQTVASSDNVNLIFTQNIEPGWINNVATDTTLNVKQFNNQIDTIRADTVLNIAEMKSHYLFTTAGILLGKLLSFNVTDSTHITINMLSAITASNMLLLSIGTIIVVREVSNNVFYTVGNFTITTFTSLHLNCSMDIIATYKSKLLPIPKYLFNSSGNFTFYPPVLIIGIVAIDPNNITLTIGSDLSVSWSGYLNLGSTLFICESTNPNALVLSELLVLTATFGGGMSTITCRSAVIAATPDNNLRYIIDPTFYLFNLTNAKTVVVRSTTSVSSSSVLFLINQNLSVSWGADLTPGDNLFIRTNMDNTSPIVAYLTVSSVAYTGSTSQITANIVNTTANIPLPEFTDYSIFNTTIVAPARILTRLATTARYIYAIDDTKSALVATVNIASKNIVTVVVNADLTTWTSYLSFNNILNIRLTNNPGDPIIGNLVVISFTISAGVTTVNTRLASAYTTVADIILFDKYLFSFSNGNNIKINTITSVSNDSITLTITQNLSPVWVNDLIPGSKLFIKKTNGSIVATVIVNTVSYGGSTTINVRLVIAENVLSNLRTETANYQVALSNKFITIYQYMWKYLTANYTTFNSSAYAALTANTSKIYIGNFTNYSNLYTYQGVLNELYNTYRTGRIPNIRSVLTNITTGFTIDNIGFSSAVVSNLNLEEIILYLEDYTTGLVNTSAYTNFPFINLLSTDTTTYYNFIENILDTQLTVGYTTWNLLNQILNNNSINLTIQQQINFNSVSLLPQSVANIGAITTLLTNTIPVNGVDFTYYSNNSNILNVDFINFNTAATYSPDSYVIDYSLNNTVKLSLKTVAITVFSVIGAFWPSVLTIGSVLNINTTNIVTHPVVSLSLTGVAFDTINNITTINATLITTSGMIGSVKTANYISYGDTTVFNLPISTVTINYEFNSVYQFLITINTTIANSWQYLIVSGTQLAIRATSSALSTILSTVIVANVFFDTVNNVVTLLCGFNNIPSLLNNNSTANYISVGDGSIFNITMNDVKIVYNYNAKYEMTDSQKWIFDYGCDSFFIPLFAASTITAINRSLLSGFKNYYNDALITDMVQGSLPVTVDAIILQSNIIQTLQGVVNALPGTPTDADKTVAMQTTGHTLIVQFLSTYTDIYVFFRSAILLQAEYTQLYPIIAVIDNLSGSDLTIYTDVTNIYTNIKLVVPVIFMSYQPSIFTPTVLPSNYFVNTNDNNTNTLLSDVVQTIGPATNTFILFRNCIITTTEQTYITTFSALPSTLQFTDSTQLNVSRVLTFDSGYRLYQNCIITVAELTYITGHPGQLPASLTTVNGAIVRTTDLPAGFTYNRGTQTITRTYIYDVNMNNVIANLLTGKRFLTYLRTYGYQEIYSIVLPLITNGIVDVKKLINIFQSKVLSLYNLFTTYNHAYFYAQGKLTSENFRTGDIIQTLLTNVYTLLYPLVNVNPLYQTTQLNSDYTTQTININNIIKLNNNSVNSLSVVLSTYQTNLTAYTSSINAQYNKYISLLPTITTIANRTSTFGNFAWTKRLGIYMINYYEIVIGDEVIDKQYCDWINIWFELNTSVGQRYGLDKMVGNTIELTTFNNTVKPAYTIYLPLPTWFSRKSVVALPIIAILYNTISFNLYLNPLADCCQIDNNVNFVQPIKLRGKLITGYIFLDNAERKLFAESNHEYLIEQVQNNGTVTVNNTAVSIPLHFYNPCKEIIWVVQLQQHINGGYANGEKQFYNYTTAQNTNASFATFAQLSPNMSLSRLIADTSIAGEYFNTCGQNPVTSATIVINNYNRFTVQSGKYFNCVQPYEGYKNTPNEGINTYSFALHPLELQPSGSCDFSFLENASLELTLNGVITNTNPAYVKVYTRSYNLLRVFSGFAGLAYYGGLD
ncbi:MAG: putative capsid protein, partial [Faunusvirus sp.]